MSKLSHLCELLEAVFSICFFIKLDYSMLYAIWMEANGSQWNLVGEMQVNRSLFLQDWIFS